MKKPQITIQVGKQGVTPGLIENIKKAFNGRVMVKLNVLKSAERDREKTEELGKEIVEELGKNYTYNRIGFTIFLKKWRKDKR